MKAIQLPNQLEKIVDKVLSNKLVATFAFIAILLAGSLAFKENVIKLYQMFVPVTSGEAEELIAAIQIGRDIGKITIFSIAIETFGEDDEDILQKQINASTANINALLRSIEVNLIVDSDAMSFEPITGICDSSVSSLVSQNLIRASNHSEVGSLYDFGCMSETYTLASQNNMQSNYFEGIKIDELSGVFAPDKIDMELRALEVTIKSIMGENRDIELVQNRQGDLDEHILSLHVGSALSDIETYLKKKK